MGTFSIYSIGDAAFLEQILIAVAMITGTGDFKQMVSIGLVLGVFIVMVQSIFQGTKQINIHHILLGWLIYACFFGPKTTVTIEDAYNGQVRVVANVPVGVGFTGGMISQIGYTLTRLFETGYGVIVPGVTTRHFTDTLKILNEVRRRAASAEVFVALNAVNGGGYVDTRRSWHNYIRECTLTKIDLNLLSLDEVMNSPTDAAMRFGSQLYGTRLYLSVTNPDGENVTCTDGWAALNQATDRLDSPLIDDALRNLLKLPPGTGTDAFSEISTSLQALGASTTTALDYVKAAILEPTYFEAAAGRYQDLQDFSSALMVNQAVQQRNTQWAAEHSMFMTVVRPMLTFFEGFIYAITPIMAFMMVIGSFGIQLAGKYLQTILWIQLWMPVLSIINLFVHTAATNQMASYATQGLDSFYALSGSGDVLQHWIATAGMLAAATPIISLFIVTGSTYAFTSLASRLSGADHLNEKMATPDTLNPGPLMQSQPGYNQNQFSGSLASGAESTIGSISFGSVLSSSLGSAKTTMEQSATAFQQTLGAALTSGTTQSQTYDRLTSLGRSIATAGTEQTSVIDQQAKSFTEQFGLANSHQDAVRGVLGAMATGSLSKEDGVSILKSITATPTASVTGSLQSSTNDASSTSTSDISSFLRGLTLSKNQAQSLTNTLAQGFNEQGGQSYANSWGATRSQQLSQSASQVVSTSHSYNELDQLSRQVGNMTNTDIRTLGGAVSRSAAATQHLNDYFTHAAPASVKQEANDLATRYQSSHYGMPPSVALAAARMTAMTNANHLEPGHATDAMLTMAKVIKSALGNNLGSVGNPYQHDQQPDVNHQSLENSVNEGVQNVALPSGFSQSNAQQMPLDEEVVSQEHRVATRDLHSQAGQTEKSFSQDAVHKAGNNLTSNSMGLAAWLVGHGDNTKAVAGRALVATGKAANEAFSKFINQFSQMSPPERQQYMAQLHANDEQFAQQHGWQGDAALFLAKGGRALIGAAANGYEAYQNWQNRGANLSDTTKDMGLMEKGVFYAAALSQASKEGTDKSSEFMQQYGQAYRDTMQQVAVNQYGLTDNQAAVFANSFVSTSPTNRQVAIDNLRMDYAELNQDGTPIMQGGKPILSDERSQHVDSMISVLEGASSAGERAGSYLNHVRAYNIADKKFR
ncbi:MAG: conjugal transfer protein TraG N-terminal domain-containing protein [Shewanella sp.]